jgi:AbrB family looped-hinge helix DNA binding protein
MEMNVMGIVRAVDDLGRIVIPMEMRKALGIAGGECLEILATSNGGLFIRKPIKVKQNASVEVTTETTITVKPVEEKKIITLYGEDYCGDLKCIKITKEQWNLLDEVAGAFNGNIPWEDLSEECPDTYDFT